MEQLSQLVSDDGCHISRRVFSDQAVYDLEQNQIFSRNWLFLCHRDQVSKPGDYFCTFMGETPVIVACGEDGAVHVSINSCSHRGLPVCRHDQGNTKFFVCPYHGWTYTVDGTLAQVPQRRALEKLPDFTELGLVAVPRVAEYEGLLFACLDPEAPSLDDYLGDMKFYLEVFLQRFPGGIELIGPPHKWLLHSNWKLPVENQLGDAGHAPFLHGALIGGVQGVKEVEDYGLTTVTSPGHGAAVRYMPESSSDEQRAWGLEGVMETNPLLQEYLLDVQRQLAERLSPRHARVKPLTLGVYPNLSIICSNATLRVAHPRAPGKVELWSWWVAPREAPEEVRIGLRKQYSFFFGPGGTLEQEDSDAWMQQFVGSRIEVLRDHPYYYGLGSGEERRHPDLPGDVGSCYNEHYARGFYQRWRADLRHGESL